MDSTILDNDLVITLDDVQEANKDREPFADGTIVTVNVIEAGDETNGTALKGGKALYVPCVLEALNDEGDRRVIYHNQSLYPVGPAGDKKKAQLKQMAVRFFTALGMAPEQMSTLYAGLVRQEAGAAAVLIGATGRARVKVSMSNKGRKRNEIATWLLANGVAH